MIRTNPRTAEMIKYASNALLATLISFSNEIANLCAALGDIDVVDVMEGVHASSYLTVRCRGRAASQGADHLLPPAGCGFGGSCLPKDVKALIAHGERRGRRCRCSRGARRQRGAARTGDPPRSRSTSRPSRACASPSWVWPSSPTPTTCASRPPSPSIRLLLAAAPP